MRILLSALILTVSGSAFASDVYVKPYVKRDGTLVEGHMRSTPNNTTTDNWTTQGNTNPYTGQQGTQQPVSNNPYSYQK